MKMSTLVPIGLVTALLVVGGYFYFAKTQETSEKSKTAAAPLVKTGSRYVEYSKTALEQAKGKRRVLYFYASWCPTCRPADESFKEHVDQIPNNVVLIRVNYNDPDTDNDEKELARKYAVTYQHAFVQIDETGNQIAIWNGGDIDNLLSMLKDRGQEVKTKEAAFAIYTNGTFRVFTLPMYHNLSKDVYIEATHPNIIKINKPGVTWNDFFKTLPFKVTSDCLTTGTKEIFCTGTGGELKFYLNGINRQSVLTEKINNGDKLLITYGITSLAELKEQFASVPTP